MRAVVVIESMRENRYFHEKALALFESVEYLADRPTEHQLSRLMREFDVLIIGARETIRSAAIPDDLTTRIIGTLSIGLDHLDLKALQERNVQVVNSPTANVPSVAEHVIAACFALAKKLKAGDRAVAARAGRQGLDGFGMEVRGKTLGLIGFGKIAKETARLATAFGLEVIATSRTRTSGFAENVRFVTLCELLRSAHLVSVSVPLTVETQGLIDLPALAAAKPGLILVNTSRPEVISVGVVRAALQKGYLGGFAGDVDDDHEQLSTLSSVIMTPHIAGMTNESNDRIDNELIDRLAAVITA